MALFMMELLAAFRESIRQIHQGLDASGANPKVWVQVMDSVPRSPPMCLVDLGLNCQEVVHPGPSLRRWWLPTNHPRREGGPDEHS